MKAEASTACWLHQLLTHPFQKTPIASPGSGGGPRRTQDRRSIARVLLDRAQATPAAADEEERRCRSRASASRAFSRAHWPVLSPWGLEPAPSAQENRRRCRHCLRPGPRNQGPSCLPRHATSPHPPQATRAALKPASGTGCDVMATTGLEKKAGAEANCHAVLTPPMPAAPRLPTFHPTATAAPPRRQTAL